MDYELINIIIAILCICVSIVPAAGTVTGHWTVKAICKTVALGGIILPAFYLCKMSGLI